MVSQKDIIEALREIAKMPIHTINESVFELAGRIEAEGIKRSGLEIKHD